MLVLDRVGVMPLADPTVVALAAAAILLTLAVIGLGLSGRRSGLVGAAATATVAGMLVSSFAVVGGSWVVAQNGSSVPGTSVAAASGYSILASSYRIDLTELPPPTRDTVVPITAIAGNLTVVVPDDVPVEVRARTALGRTDVPGDPGRGTSGLLDHRDRAVNTEATGSTLVLDVRGALSNITIRTWSDTGGLSSAAIQGLGTGEAR